MSRGQEHDVEFHHHGLGRIQIDSNAAEMSELLSLSKAELKTYIFIPNHESYKSLDLQYLQKKQLPFEFRNVFVAFDSLMNIKKIVLFLEGHSDDIVKFLKISISA